MLKHSKEVDTMEYVYAAMLLHEAGQDIDEGSVTDVLDAAGVDPEESRVKALTASLDDVDIDEAVENAAVTQAAAPAAPDQQADQEQESAEDGQEDDGDEAADEPEDEGASEEEAAEGLGALFE